MSSPVIHILNGDALGDQFPKDLPGEILIFRECLIEGPKNVVEFESFFASRAAYLSGTYDPKIKESYSRELSIPLMRVVTEQTPVEVVLWFEEDLFCQANFWFICHFLEGSGYSGKVTWGKPSGIAKYNFGLLSKESLKAVFKERLPIDLTEIAPLWQAYSINDSDELIRLVEGITDLSEFIIPAAIAYRDMNTSTVEQSRPYLSLLEITKTQKTAHFGKIFMAFCQKEAVYGLGDLQVKRIFNKVVALER
jgi:hypothetical protein